MKRFNQETESILTNIKKAEITPNDSKNGKGKMNLLDANPTIFAYKEHLFRDTVEATFTYKDTGGKFNGTSLLEGLNVIGTEDVLIEIEDLKKSKSKNGEDNGRSLKLNLNVNQVKPLVTNTRTQDVALTLVPEEFIRNELESSLVKIRYDGRIDEHVKKILKENLKSKLKEENIQETSNNYNFIGNRQKPLYILKWLAKKSFSNKDGKSGDTAGYVCYQTSDSKGLKFNFKSIDSLFSQDSKATFVYNETSETQNNEKKITKFFPNNNLTANKKLRMGAYHTKLIVFDPFNCKFDEVIQKADETKKGTTLAAKNLPKLNKKFTEVPTRTTYVLKDTGTLPTGEVDEQLELSDKEIFEPEKILNQAVRRYNQFSFLSCEIEVGLDLSLHVGDTVDIESKSLNQLSDGARDKMTGGKYLIVSLTHTFTSKNVVTRLGLVRDSSGREPKKNGMVT
tara:strand:+ start:212 stop:1570 length:1359 start_codon:yes stop_codon:yes gene_type:complete